MSDELLELPEGWKIGKLDDILSIKSGEAFKKKDYSLSGIRLLQIANVSFGKVIWEQKNFLPEEFLHKYPELVLDKNDVVMALNRPIINDSLKIALLQESDAPAILYQRVACFNLLVKDMREYFFYYANSPSFIQLICDNLQGTDQPYINTSTLPNLPIPLPPLNEQKRIVAKIEELSDRSQTAQKALETIPQLCDRFRQSVLAAAFRGDLTADWREKNPDVEPASVLLERIRGLEQLEVLKAQLDISDLPNNWTWVDLGTLGKISGGITKNSKRENLPLEFPYLRVANVYADYLELNEIKTIKIREEEYERVALQKGDLLVVEGNGSIDQVGRVCIWDGSISPCLHQNHLIKIRFHPIQIGNYVLIWLLSNGGRQQIIRVASSTSGLHTLSLSKVSDLKMPLAPLSEQQEIFLQVRKLFKIIEAIEKQHKQATEKLERLNQSILSKAFRGELVPQDPEDEPASVLLERIRAEREKLNNSKPKSTSKRKSKTPKEQGTIPGLE